MCANKNSGKEYKLFRVWDILVIVLVMALLTGMLCMILLPRQGNYAEIYVDGTLVSTVSLDRSGTIPLDGLTVVVEKGYVYVVDSDCPDKICEKAGKINRSGETIICLPNKVIIKVVGKEKGEVEAIT